MIRQATSEDAAAVSTLIVAAYQGYVERLGRNPQPMTDDYASLIAAGQVWVVDSNDSLAGVLVCQNLSDEMLVRTVGVAPHLQRAGLGSYLMGQAELLARDAGIGTLRLYTNETMTGNVELYQRLGYHETHREGPDGRQVVYMLKVL